MYRISTAFVVGMAIVGIAWVLVGVAMVCLGSRRILAGFGSQQWPHVQGHITQSDLLPVKNSRGEVVYYRVYVAYSYLPSKKKYVCSNNGLSTRGFIDPADDSYSLTGAQHFTRRFPVGQAVTVFYRPGEKVVSTLRPGTDIGTWGASLMGLISLLLGTLILRFIAAVGSRSKLKVKNLDHNSE